MKTINQDEIAHFQKDSSHWWDENGPFKPLHRLNPVRIAFIRDQVTAHFDVSTEAITTLSDLSVIDVGCGGGLVCEPLARLGADVTGIDADENAIAVAQDHARRQGLNINYDAKTTEDVIAQNKQYDIVLALEIIEHVNNPNDFVHECFQLCKPGGLVIFSTLNKTLKSYGLGIIAAEYLLGWVPKGTHDWNKFIKPSTLSAYIRSAGGLPLPQKGLIFNPLKNKFKMSDTDLDVNYFITATHNS